MRNYSTIITMDGKCYERLRYQTETIAGKTQYIASNIKHISGNGAGIVKFI